MALKVHRAGILSTLQDLGRYGYQRFGVPVGGVMDEYSHRLANLLVGNAEQEATLEITLAGPRLEFTEDALIGVCGGDFTPTIDGKKVPVARPVLVGVARGAASSLSQLLSPILQAALSSLRRSEQRGAASF
jgi:antagonist of KipI